MFLHHQEILYFEEFLQVSSVEMERAFSQEAYLKCQMFLKRLKENPSYSKSVDDLLMRRGEEF